MPVGIHLIFGLPVADGEFEDAGLFAAVGLELPTLVGGLELPELFTGGLELAFGEFPVAAKFADPLRDEFELEFVLFLLVDIANYSRFF